jgi:hypothetical protein
MDSIFEKTNASKSDIIKVISWVNSKPSEDDIADALELMAQSGNEYVIKAFFETNSKKIDAEIMEEFLSQLIANNNAKAFKYVIESQAPKLKFTTSILSTFDEFEKPQLLAWFKNFCKKHTNTKFCKNALKELCKTGQ